MNLTFPFVHSVAVAHDRRTWRRNAALGLGGFAALSRPRAVDRAFAGIDGSSTVLVATAVLGGIMSGIVSWRSGILIPALHKATGFAARLLTLGRAGRRRTAAVPAAAALPLGSAFVADTPVRWGSNARLR